MISKNVSVKILTCIFGSQSSKVFFPVKIISDFLNKIYIYLDIMPNASFIWGRIKMFQVKFAAGYLAVTVFMQRRVYS